MGITIKIAVLLMAAQICLWGASATAQVHATSTESCAEHLNTSAEPTVGALLNCLVEMQRAINDLQQDVVDSASASLSDADVRRIAGVMASDHREAFKGDAGVQGRQGSDIELPVGLVAAFYRSERGAMGACPPGWSLFREAGGRFIVGAGGHTNVDENGERLTRHPSAFDLPEDAVGGAETHSLTEAQLPEHSHGAGELYAEPFGDYLHVSPDGNMPGGDRRRGVFEGGRWESNFGAHGHDVTGTTETVGKDQPHNNMPPYIALYFCKKE